MATLVKTAQGRWKSVIRRRGRPAVAKTFRTKRDAADWGRATEEAMVRGVFLQRASVHGLDIKDALARHLAEVTPTKRRSTQYRERGRAATLVQHLGGYSLVTLTPEIIASFRDARLAAGKSRNTVRLELALLSHLYAIAMREWRPALPQNPVPSVRKGRPGKSGKRGPYRFEKVWNDLKKRIGLADLHFHDLRHEAVSRFVELGLSDQEVAAISGHKSMQMLKRYTHLRAEELVARLDRAMQ